MIVVQFTSFDPKCGYCRGQDNVFDAFAANQTSKAGFARVQWAPWRPFPTLAMSESLYGVPTCYLFTSGRVVGEYIGRLTDLAKLSKLNADALEAKVEPRLDPAASQPPAVDKGPVARAAVAPLCDADRQARVRLARRDLARETIQRCAAANPAEAEAYRSALAGWQSRHQAELNQATLLMVTRSSPADAADATDATEIATITETQARRLQNEAPMSSPTPRGCGGLTSALSD